MSCARHVNVRRMHARLNGGPLEERIVLSIPEVTSGSGCERDVHTNEGYKVLGVLKNVPSNSRLGTYAKKSI